MLIISSLYNVVTSAARNTIPWNQGQGNDRIAAILKGATLVLACGVVFAHVLLVRMGHWEPDEYHNLGLLRQLGWSRFWDRLLHWSPRLLSESLIGIYYLAVEYFRRPLIVSSLLLLWGLVIGSVIPFVWRARIAGHRLTRLSIACAVLAMFLLGHRIAEMFYWPIGAVAYAVTLAGVSLVVFEVVDGQWRARGGLLLCIAGLFVAAGSSEAGAIFTACFAASMVLLHLLGLLDRRGRALIWLVPLLFALGVVLLLAFGRGSMMVEQVIYQGMTPNARYLHHPLASLLRATPTFLRHLAMLDHTMNDRGGLAQGILLKTAFLLGLMGCLRGVYPVPRSRAERLVLMAMLLSLLGMCWISIAGSYYQYGVPCCERHETLRQCLSVLAEVVLAALVMDLTAGRSFLGQGSAVVGPMLLSASLVVLSIARLPDLVLAYRLEPTYTRIDQENWNSGAGPGDQMTFRVILPPPPVVGGMLLPLRGHFSLENSPWHVQLFLNFFNKKEIEFDGKVSAAVGNSAPRGSDDPDT